MKIDKRNNDYIEEIKDILSQAKQQVYTAVNTAMVQAYWLIGKRIVEEEQNGKERAEYGSFLIKNLSKELTQEFGKGFSEREIREIRQFYLTFPDLNIRHSPSAELQTNQSSSQFSKISWTHIRQLLRVTNPEARTYYINSGFLINMSYRQL